MPGLLLEQTHVEVTPAVSREDLQTARIGLLGVAQSAVAMIDETDAKPGLVHLRVILDHLPEDADGVLGVAPVEKHGPQVHRLLRRQLALQGALPVLSDGLVSRIVLNQPADEDRLVGCELHPDDQTHQSGNDQRDRSLHQATLLWTERRSCARRASP